MKVTIAFGEKAGQVLHVARDQHTYNMIESGFWKTDEDLRHPSANPDDAACHAIPPKPVSAPRFSVGKTARSATVFLKVEIPRGETIFFSADAGDPHFKFRLAALEKYCGVPVSE